MPNRKTNPRKDPHTTIRVPEEMLARFREIEALEHRTPSQGIRRLIEQRVREYEQEAEAA
jgi:predicted DNA-binding protein